jgi:hypothetical protein
MVLDALKKRLYKENDKHLGRWLKELSAMIWGLRTQPSRNTSISPYFMVFGSEAVLPVDIAFQSPRVENHDEKSDEARELEVNCAEETCACTAKYLEGLRRYYNHNIKDRFFMVGYLVPIWSRRSLALHLTGCVILMELTSALGVSMLDALLNKDMYSFCIRSIQ